MEGQVGGGIDGIVPAADGVLSQVRALDAAYARFHTKWTRRVGPSRDLGIRVAISCTYAGIVRRCLTRLRTGSTNRWILPNKRREARRCDLHGVSTYSNLS